MKKIIAGVDEVGRGSLVGRVYAAAIIFKKSMLGLFSPRNFIAVSVSRYAFKSIDKFSTDRRKNLCEDSLSSTRTAVRLYSLIN